MEKLKKLLAAAAILLPPASAATAEKWYEPIFVSGAVQRHFTMAELSEYIAPKPGFRFGLGYSLFHEDRHSFPLSIEFGHSVIEGTNSLVRSFDIYPIQAFGGYEFTPIPLVSVGASLGAGAYYASIDHYETAIDLIKNRLSTTAGSGFLFSGKIGGGINLFKKAVQLRANILAECICEKDGIIALPSASITLAIFPGRAYSLMTAPPEKEVVEVEKVVEKEVSVEKVVEKTVEVERVVEKEVPVEKVVEKTVEVERRVEVPYLLSNTFIIYFGPEDTELSEKAREKLDGLAALLKEYPDTSISITGSAAPFDNAADQLDVATVRSWAIFDYLNDAHGIPRYRMVVRKPAVADQSAKSDRTEAEQLRSVTIQVYQ